MARDLWIRPRIEGRDDLSLRLEQLPERLAKKVVRKALLKTAGPFAVRAQLLKEARVRNPTQTVPDIKVRDLTKKRLRMLAAITDGAPHAHLLNFGTVPRYTRKGAYRGQGPALRHMTDAFNDLKDEQVVALAAEVEAGIEREYKNAAKKGIVL